MDNQIIKLKNVSKDYQTVNEKIEALKDINYIFEKGKLYAIKGHSGSGKTTLVNILGLMLKPTSGEYFLYDNLVSKLEDTECSNYRLNHIGFIFQDYNLNPYLTAYENVLVPMIINKNIEKKDRKEEAEKLLNLVGLKERINHFPNELSGGEQQRVAIARSLANNPEIIIADEPTGNLDKENEKMIFSLLKQLSQNGKCVIVVSHSDEILEIADVYLKLEDGRLEEVKK